MPQYQNLNGASAVVSFEIETAAISVTFSDGARYKYSIHSAGAQNIETMKALALSGRGLNTFINKTVRNRYESKTKATSAG